MAKVSANKPGGNGETPKSVYFLSLELENVRCFGPKQTLDLSDGKGGPARWTVLLGENGVGKTTVLQALAAFSALQVSSELELHPSMTSYLVRWRPMRSAKRARLVTRLSEGELTGQSLGSPRSCSRSLTVGGDSFWFNGLPRWAKDLPCYGYGASRRMGTGALTKGRNEFNARTLYDEHADLRNAEEWLLQADYSATKWGDAATKAYRDRVKDLLIELLPEVTDLRFVAPKTAVGGASVEALTSDGWIPLSGLSLGYRTMLAWMVDLASRLAERHPDSENPLAEPAVVLVDEIDLHLHPRWQRELFTHLTTKFPRTQFIVTAHSPLVVQSAPDANLALLRRVGDHVEIVNDVEQIRNWRLDQIYTSELFGLPTARPSWMEPLLDERKKLLSKARLTAKDKARVAELEQRLGPLPTEERHEDQKTLDILRRAAEALEGGKP